MVTVESESVERELKFEADSVRVEDLPGEPVGERLFDSVYFDTEGALLLTAGITLRRRTEEGRTVWQLKLPRSDGRLELEEPGRPAGPPDVLAALLRARLRGRSLAPVATLRTHRSGRELDQARVTLDRVEVLEDRRTVAHFCEVEAELTNGSADLGAIKRRLKKAGARATDGRSKLHRALATLDLTPAPRKLPKPSASAIDLFRGYLAQQLDELTAHDPAIRVGGDPEDVHDMRVVVRRLRTALKTAKPMIDPAAVEELRSELGWLADALAPVRDLDVLIEDLDEEIVTLDAGDAVTAQHLMSPLRDRRRSAEERLKQTLDSDRYLNLLDRIEARRRHCRAVVPTSTLTSVPAGNTASSSGRSHRSATSPRRPRCTKRASAPNASATRPNWLPATTTATAKL